LDHRSFTVVHVQSRSSTPATQTLTTPVSIFPFYFCPLDLDPRA
jgi:hypothetical protein